MFPVRPVLALAGAFVLLIGSATAAQQPSESPPMRYRIRAGDTLISLSTRYLTDKEDYRTIQAINRIADPRRLPIGSTLVIPERLLRSEPVAGEITSFRGEVSIDGQLARLRMPIRQGMQIVTGTNAFVTIELPDQSTLSLPSQSSIRVDRLRRVLLTDSLDRQFRLQTGRSRAKVRPMTNPDSRFRVTTPLSVSAVRGTDFRIGFDPQSKRAITEVVGGSVGVAPDIGADEISVPGGFGVVGTVGGIQPPIPLLPAPELTQLGRGAGDVVVIGYKPVPGAKSYRVQLATDLDFQDIIAESATDALTTSFPGLSATPFFVRLTAIAESGLEGMPGTFASGRRGNDNDGGAGPGAPSAPAAPPTISMRDDARSNPATSGTGAALR